MLTGTLQDPLRSGSFRGEPGKRPRLWQVVIGLAILVVALAVLASQLGGGDGGGSLNAIAAAAERTQRESGGRATMHSVVTLPGRSGSISITGQMVFDTETGRSRVVMEVPDPDSDDLVEMEVVGDGAHFYLHSDLFGSLPGGREWMGLDFSSFGLEPNTELPTNGDAKGELELLEAVTGDVQKLGKEDVRDVQTTRYRGTIGVSEQAQRLREEGGEDLASYVEEQGTPVRVEVWIDADGLVRRSRLIRSGPSPDDKGSMTTDVRIDFFGFGDVPEIDVPDQSEVFDATALAHRQIDVSRDD